MGSQQINPAFLQPDSATVDAIAGNTIIKKLRLILLITEKVVTLAFFNRTLIF
jgi:hypothetical protein